MNSELDKIHIANVLSGDRDAFRHFVRSYQEMGYSIALSMVKNESDARDVVQNAFIRAYKSLRSFRQDSKFSTWFYKIVVNESLKYLKKNKRASNTITFKDDTNDYTAVFNEAVKNMDAMDRKMKINKVLNLIRPKEALVLKLHYLHEKPILEIEKITGFTISNVKVLLHRARKSFSALFVQFNN